MVEGGEGQALAGVAVVDGVLGRREGGRERIRQI